MPTHNTTSPTLREASWLWLKIGCLSFGGPAGQIALLHREVVEKHRWINEEEFLHALNFCMILPGPEAQQLATYLGWLLHGKRGGILSGILFILPSFFLILLLAALYLLYGNLPWVASIFWVFQSIVLAIMLESFGKIAKKGLKTPTSWLLAALFAILSIGAGWSFLPLLALAIPIGFTLQRFFPNIPLTSPKSTSTNPPEIPAPSPATRKINQTKSLWPSTLQTLLAGLTLWLISFLTLLATAGKTSMLSTMADFFTRAALVTFGGAYAVLPYVKLAFVDQFHWVSTTQMLDALALGESTPGPLIMVLPFLAFIAAAQQSLSLSAGTIAATVATWFTFLPSFFFIFIGAPWIERSRQNPHLQTPLQVIRIAVMSQMLLLVLFFAKELLLHAQKPQWGAAAIVLLAWLALVIAKRSTATVLAAGLILGLLLAAAKHLF